MLPFSGSPPASNTIDYDFLTMFNGTQFEVPVLASAMTTGTVYGILFTPATGLYTYLRPLSVTTTGDKLLCELFENPVAAGGTAQPVRNKNRNTTGRIASATVTAGVTITNPGDLLSSQETAAFHLNEHYGRWILNPAKNYLIRLTNKNALPQDVILTLSWYEIYM